MSDYIDPRIRKAVEKAVDILLAHRSEWRNEIDAYWLLVKYEDEIGVPVIYELVKEAVDKAREELQRVPASKTVTVEA